MPDYTRATKTANRMIKDAGKPAALRVMGASDGWDPSSGSSTDHPCTVVELEYSVYERQSTLIEVNDKKVMLAVEGLTVMPSAEHQLVMNGDVYSIIRANPFQPGPVTIFYELQVRR